MAEEIRDEQSLRTFYGDPNFRAARKQMPKLDKHTRHFISLSPFLVLSTAGENGTDASPRGDAPGFVAVIDDETIVIPDRPGNNRVDSMTNIMENPNVGMLFLVPGIKETLRDATAEAVSRGAFGAPTFFWRDRMFFGNDRLGLLEGLIERA